MKEEIQEIPKTPMTFLWRMNLIHKRWIIPAVLLVVLGALSNTGMSYLFKLIVEATEKGDAKSVVFWVLAFPFLLFLIQISYRLSGFFAGQWFHRVFKTSSDKLFKYILQHSHGYYINRFAGSVTNKVRNVVGAMDSVLPDFLWGYLPLLVTMSASLVLIYLVDPMVALLFAGLILILIIVNLKLSPKKARLSRIFAESNTKLQGRLVDVITNASMVRQYTKHDYELGELASLTTNRKETGYKSFMYSEWMLVLNSIILFIFTSVMVLILVDGWKAGDISTGDFVLIISLVYNMSGLLIHIAKSFSSVARAIGEMKEGLEDLLVDYEITDDKSRNALKISKGKIECQDVNFTFKDNLDNSVFSNFNLTISAGQRVGLVGSSGAGKTTFVSLLLRQHDINSGEILIDGQNISKVTQDSLRSAIAVVPQEPSLFHRTIKENIAYGNENATDEEIIAVAKKANAHEFIEKLTDGYDTLVGERGVKLSGGQKQRVAIARAMLKNSPILILDEATSALDSESEVLIQQALHKLMAGKTVVAIAHRLSTLREMDRIIVLENGKIVEDGTHTALIKNKGVYAKLWNHQSGGFVTE